MMQRIAVGALAGALATIPMTAAMLAMHRRLPEEEQYNLPPREITEVLALKAGQHQRVEPQLRELSLASHFAYGAATGALYSLLVGRGRSSVYLGSAYGLGVWAASYLGWIPAANLLQPATRHPWRRNALMLAAHVVWGGGLAIAERQLSGWEKDSRSGTNGVAAPTSDRY